MSCTCAPGSVHSICQALGSASGGVNGARGVKGYASDGAASPAFANHASKSGMGAQRPMSRCATTGARTPNAVAMPRTTPASAVGARNVPVKSLMSTSRASRESPHAVTHFAAAARSCRGFRRRMTSAKVGGKAAGSGGDSVSTSSAIVSPASPT